MAVDTRDTNRSPGPAIGGPWFVPARQMAGQRYRNRWMIRRQVTGGSPKAGGTTGPPVHGTIGGTRTSPLGWDRSHGSI